MTRIFLLFFLSAFVFQTLLYQVLFSALVISARMEAQEEAESSTRTILTQQQFNNLHWLNESEIIFKDYLLDITEVKRTASNITLSFKVDFKEKSFLEKLLEGFRHGKNKKTMASSPNRICEPYTMNFHAPVSRLLRSAMGLCICSVNKAPSSPPPKI